MARWPGVKLARNQATYLAWIDARRPGPGRSVAFFEQAGVGLSPGPSSATASSCDAQLWLHPGPSHRALARMENHSPDPLGTVPGGG